MNDAPTSPDDSRLPSEACENDPDPHVIEKNMTGAEIHRGLDKAKLKLERGLGEPGDRSPLILFLNTEYTFPTDHAFCFNLDNEYLPVDKPGQEFVSIYNANRRWDDKPIKSPVRL